MRSSKLCFRIAAFLVLIAAESALPSRAQTAGPSHVYENLGTVLPRTGIPSTAIWRQANLLYGEAVDPDTDKGPFVVYDLNKRKVLYSGNEDIHTGFRCIAVVLDLDWNIPEAELSEYSTKLAIVGGAKPVVR